MSQREDETVRQSDFCALRPSRFEMRAATEPAIDKNTSQIT
jgi:hypothetical protein